jgi:hypothetical protein
MAYVKSSVSELRPLLMATVYHLRGIKGPAVNARKCVAVRNLNLRERAAGYPMPRLGYLSLLEALSRCADEPEPAEIKTVDEHVDRSHRVILSHIVIKRCRKQRALPAIQRFNKALHQMPPQIAGNLIARITANRAFSHSLGHELTCTNEISPQSRHGEHPGLMLLSPRPVHAKPLNKILPRPF